ncbi:MAG: MBOAT family O-acyltransferase [Clostridiaceae bacterium]
MTLTSFSFFIFVIATLFIYYIVPKKHQWIILLGASYCFYLITCNKYVIYLIVTTATTFFGGIAIDKIAKKSSEEIKVNKEIWSREEKKAFKEVTQKRKRAVLVSILLLNFGILAFLKYFNFFSSSIFSLLELFGLNFTFRGLNLVLPLGISFYTFQSMGYIIDVYRGKFPAERSLAKFSLFVSFFPQIIQGPIAYYSDLAHQLYESHKLKYENLKWGSQLILWGLFKKIVIADRAVKMINIVSGDYRSFSGTYILLTIFMYALQLYADFSGGIDICRGVGEMFGITMAENFRRPYFSKSLTEYWHRWHITLGEWLRNYLFYPLSLSKAFMKLGKNLKKRFGNHLGKVLPTSLASLITFIVIGIWHGANWKYVAFGVWNGGVIMASALCEPALNRLVEKLKINRSTQLFGLFSMVRTFILVLIGYYFDVAENFTSAMNMMRLSLLDFHISDLINIEALKLLGLYKFDYLVLLIGIIIIFISSLIQEKTGRRIRDILDEKPLMIRWPVYIAGIFLVILMGVYGPGTSASEFVYMQF